MLESSETHGAVISNRECNKVWYRHGRAIREACEDGEISLCRDFFLGESRGSATTTDLSDLALQDTVDAALAITAPDPSTLLASNDQIIHDISDFRLDHPWEIIAEEAIDLAIEIEATGRDEDHKPWREDAYLRPEGSRSMTSEGLMVSQPTSMHGMSCMLLAEDGESRERSYAYTQSHRSIN